MGNGTRTKNYNERLFAGGIRGRVHSARFRWLAESVTRYSPDFSSVLELGCFDGKAIEHLPAAPSRYLGLDANWEGGLDMAAEKWADHDSYKFRKCTNPADDVWDDEPFDIGICMETLEHIPLDLVGPYLERMSKSLRGNLFISVPVEIGPVFLVKHLAKKLILRDAPAFTFKEVLASTFGRTELVERNQHKGFDWRKLLNQVSEHYEVVHVTGFPFAFLPPTLNIGVGIVAKPKGHLAASQ